MFSATSDRNKSHTSTSTSIASSKPCHHFKFHEILVATNNFDKSFLIGYGGFGKVYKGNIINGSTVFLAAIKRLDPMSGQGASEFWAEVEMLSNFRHCHLVSLFGYCNHNKEMILVYEYMPNGSLGDHLHKFGTPLCWLQRLKISIGAARGLDYLHTGTGINIGVIHRDVKSSNILLHESWAAKISDFGLSKIGPKDKPLTYVNTRVKGTFGYLDPDYSFTGKLTRKSDVYAFGVVLLELLCRKRAVDGSSGEEPRNLARWAQESIKEGNLKHIIDSSIRGEINPKCLKEFVRITERCLLLNPKQRPAMAEVVVGLNYVLLLQEKSNTSGKTILGKMLDIFPSPSNRDNSANGDSNPSSKGNNKNTSLKVFKFADLERATKHFSRDLLLATDHFGDVFLGWVDNNTFSPSKKGVGIAIAVRRYNGDFLEEWQKEVGMLRRLDHPNIIRLLGYCDDKRSPRLIVSECMENKNLFQSLYKDPDVAARLSWGTRLRIMIGVARALVYLHSSRDQIIHREVTSANIFLDRDFNAKLGGYRTRRFVRIGSVSVGSDIYSFGVLLLEVLTGKHRFFLERPRSRSGHELSLAEWAKSSYLAKDTTDLQKICIEQSCSLKDALEWVTLAIRCLAKDPKDRPLSDEVLQSLERIYDRGEHLS